MTSETVRVAAAVIVGSDGRVLLAQRPPGKVYAGYWEFPGGKLEAGETPGGALARELREELGLEVRQATPWLVRRHDYAHARVELHFLRVGEWGGEPHGREGQALCWQDPAAPTVAPLLPANIGVMRALALPDVYAISMAEELGSQSFLCRAESALARGVRLIQLREKAWPHDKRALLARDLGDLARAHGARILLNGSAEEARRLAMDGVHWSSKRLWAALERPHDLLCAASCHDAAELARAAELGLDFVVLGPLADTPGHEYLKPIGWTGFGKLIRAYELPVYALGGLGRQDLPRALQAGAQGVAMRRAAWPDAAVKSG